MGRFAQWLGFQNGVSALAESQPQEIAAVEKSVDELTPAGESIATEIFSLLNRSTPPKRNAQKFLDAYNTHPWLRAAEHRIAGAVSTTRWRLFARRTSNARAKRGKTLSLDDAFRGGGRWRQLDAVKYVDQRYRDQEIKQLRNRGELVEIVDHPVFNILSRPSPLLGGNNILKLMTIYVDILGESPIFKQLDNGQLTGLWPLPPHWIQEIASPQRPFFTVQFSARGSAVDIPANQMIWIVDVDPVNPYTRGSGVVGALADELDSSEALAKYVKSFFFNQARPDGIVEVPGASRGALKKYKLGWNSLHQGFLQAFRMHFVNKEIKVHQIGSTDLREMSVSDLGKDLRDTFAQVIGIPPEKLGIVENSNRATADAADGIFAKDVIVPRLESHRSNLQHSVIDAHFDDRFLLDYDSPIPADREAETAAAEARPFTLTVNEWRRLQGFEEDPDGDVYVVEQQGMMVAYRSLSELLAALTPDRLNQSDNGPSVSSDNSDESEDDTDQPESDD